MDALEIVRMLNNAVQESMRLTGRRPEAVGILPEHEEAVMAWAEDVCRFQNDAPSKERVKRTLRSGGLTFNGGIRIIVEDILLS